MDVLWLPVIVISFYVLVAVFFEQIIAFQNMIANLFNRKSLVR